MNFDPNIHAELVYDGGDCIYVPERLGTPSASQLQGTPLEQLAELAGRVCYDSLGAEKSRDSAAYHRHIQEVRHLSVYEHCAFAVVFPSRVPLHETLYALLNRPGVYVRMDGTLRLTVNLRAVLEFAQMGRTDRVASVAAAELEKALTDAAFKLAPQVFEGRTVPLDNVTLRPGFTLPVATLVLPETDAEKWISLLLCGSRGMSHEQVRHGDWTGISQRSTRYVNEDESPWVRHPLVTVFLDNDRGLSGDSVARAADVTQTEATNAYGLSVRELESWLTSRGVDKFTARKQARGAARGYLGNALYTEMIFSASVAQWRYMLRARCSDAADAEIRVLYSRALGELKRSRYGDSFHDMTLRPATDGIGEVLA